MSHRVADNYERVLKKAGLDEPYSDSREYPTSKLEVDRPRLEIFVK